jgi:hypothetical protein
MITPLSFNCSPQILTQDHAWKIRLFQVVKKRVAPKLHSVKLEPGSLLPDNSPHHHATVSTPASGQHSYVKGIDEKRFHGLVYGDHSHGFANSRTELRFDPSTHKIRARSEDLTAKLCG